MKLFVTMFWSYCSLCVGLPDVIYELNLLFKPILRLGNNWHSSIPQPIYCEANIYKNVTQITHVHQ